MIKKIDIAGICMWAIYLILLGSGFAVVFAGGGMEQNVEQNIIAQKIIEVTTVVPEDDWTDYLEWIVPGVITPIILFYAGYKMNKRRK